MQQKFILPLNRDTEPLFYNLRMIIDNKVLTEPRAWKITKVNRLTSNGLTHITLAQDFFDEHNDYIELDTNGNVIGMWADYFKQGQVLPTKKEEPPKNVYSSISYSGNKPEIKVNGSYKKFTVNIYDGETDTNIPYVNGIWKFEIRNGGLITPAPADILTILTNQDSTDVADNQIKIKFDGDDSYIGKVLVISNSTVINGVVVESSIEIDIRAL